MRKAVSIDGVLFCRRCGGARAGAVWVRSSEVPTALLHRLMLYRPHEAPDMIEFLWPDPDLEPENATKTIYAMAHYWRRAGVPIEGCERGFRLAV